MVRNKIGYAASMLIALALLAGPVSAQPLAAATGDGGGQAQGQAHGAYHADASGALDEADQQEDELQDKAVADAREANRTYAEAKEQTWADAKATETPERPACPCDEIADDLEEQNSMSASHASAAEKAANVENEYVDAGADVGASGQADAWYSNLFEGATDAFDRVRSVFGYETQADEQAKDVAESAVHADDELRGEAIATLDEDRELPDANPRLDGELDAEHASEASSSAVGHADGEIP